MKNKPDTRKIVLIGTGFVGMSFAFSLLGGHICDELVLIDIDKKKAEGEAMDLNHGLAFSGSNMKIYAGDYKDCTDADLIVICAGVSQKPGEDRISLLKRNSAVFSSIIENVSKTGFDGIYLVASNPVDIMSYMTMKKSNFPRSRVFGTGTTLDTARLRYLLGTHFEVDPRNIHAYVMGEHGDTEFIPWSQAYLSTKSVLSICKKCERGFSCDELSGIETEVRCAAQKIIEAKKATYYGIAMSLLRIVKAIFGDEHTILTLSAYLDGEYGEDCKGVYTGVPCVVSRQGVERIITLDLTDEEKAKLKRSCDFLREINAQLE